MMLAREVTGNVLDQIGTLVIERCRTIGLVHLHRSRRLRLLRGRMILRCSTSSASKSLHIAFTASSAIPSRLTLASERCAMTRLIQIERIDVRFTVDQGARRAYSPWYFVR